MVKALQILVGIVVFDGLALEGLGKISPSFRRDHCAWDATHIVVVSGANSFDGKAKVVESWKGDLKNGNIIAIPELAAFAPPKMRRISERFRLPDQPKHAAHVTGSRMVLFLIRDKGGDHPSWKPANRLWNRLDVSLAWIEHGSAYSVHQLVNPGPSELVLPGTEIKLRRRVTRIAEMQTALSMAIAQSDAKKLKEALYPLAQFNSQYIAEASFGRLNGSSRPALLLLRMMRRDASLTKYRASIEEAMARIGDEALGAETSARAREDLAYWKKTGPGLSHGWWEGKGISSREAEAVRNRMRQTLATVKLLRLNRLAASEKEKVIAEIRGLWASLPQLKDIAEVLDVIDEAKKQLR